MQIYDKIRNKKWGPIDEKTKHLLSIYFLLLIPYLCSLTLIGICYNALVRHSSDIFRSFIGALVGTIIMFAIKATIQRPLDLVSDEVPNNLFKQILRFYSIRRRKFLLICNCLVDFCPLPACHGLSKKILLTIFYYWQFRWNSLIDHANFNMYWRLY